MKRICFFLSFWCLLALTAQAQRPASRNAERTPPPAEERARKMTEKLRTDLGLSPEQAEKVYQINLQAAQTHDEHRQARTAERAEMRDQMQAVETARDESLRQVLDDAQQKRYETLKAERQEKRQGRMKNRRGGMEK